jgi:hypothetical protein
MIALRVQQTALSGTLAAFTSIAQQANSTPIPPATLDANLATATAQVELAATLQAQQAPVNPSSEGDIPDPSERQLRSAKILLFEDMSASRYIRIVKEALDQSDYFYQDVGSAKGWFKTQLLSPMKWDLVIAAAEADRAFGGEFFEYIDRQLADGAAAVVENWDIDLAPAGKAGLLLRRCGVRFDADWFEPRMRVFYWLQPDDPIFNQPYKMPSQLHNATRIWSGDIGDLLEIDHSLDGNGGNPKLLAGINPQIKDRHALLVSCLNGRLTLQTFRTHEYQHDEMLDLWKNYIYQALKSYFAVNGQTPPTPVLTAQAEPVNTPTPYGPTPGPEYTLEHGCDGLFAVRLRSSPQFQQDLFEHHAEGEFLVLHLGLRSEANFPIMIWRKDYFVEGTLDGKAVIYSPNPDATGYLFIDRNGHLYQDVIQPGESWNVSVAFDINPRATNLSFVFRPGSQFNEQACEAKIDLAH